MRCNRCTSIFDHHCKFVNNCVGERNYKTFICLIISVEVFALYLFVLCVIKLVGQSEMYSYWDVPVFVLLFATLSILCSNGYLIGFHVYLNLKKMTTFEYISFKILGSAAISPQHRSEEHNLSILKERENSLIFSPNDNNLN
jgi:DHHC palmitoyltransferase